MKISVIVAYHGEVNYIGDCLASLAEQSCRDFEVIVVCDGCEEPGFGKGEKMGSLPNIQVVKLPEAGGVAAARNAGLGRASGEYVYFLDADDYIDVGMLEKLAELAEPDTLVYGACKSSWCGRRVYMDQGIELDERDAAEERNRVGDEEEEESARGGESRNVSDNCENPYEYLMKRTKVLQNITVLGILIPRAAVEGNQIRFDEELSYFSDLPFLLQVLNSVERARFCPDGFYIKRKHNDPVNLPSLLQKKDEEKKIFEAMRMYAKYKPLVPKGERELWLDQRFVRFLVTKISPFVVSAKTAKRQEIAPCLKEALDQLGDGVLGELRRHPRRLVKYGRSGQIDKIAKKTRWHARRQTLFRVCTSRAKMKRYLYEKVFTKMKPLPNTVMFESFFGKSYSDSPKYIFEYLNRAYPGKYKYVWVNAGRNFKLPYPAKQAKRFRLSYFYYMARCRYLVFNGRQPQYFVKRKGSVFLETWHGTPLKKLVFDMEDVTSASPLYKEQFYIQTRSWDYLVAPNQFSEDIFRHAFMYDGEMLRTGYPRNDILYSEDKETLAGEIKRELGIPQDKKVILYAPTWRDDEFYGHAKYKFSMKLDLDRMREAIGEEYVILLRTHYFVADFLDLSAYGGFAYNLSRYDDIARLYLVSDVLITDYSSVFFDYANLRRPMLFFTYDLEKYRDVLRGFYIDIEEELPGPMLFDTEEVINAVRRIDEVQSEYADKYSRFCEKYCAWEDGHAAEKIVKTVFPCD